MTVLVTGSAGHLGEGLMRTLRARSRPARGLDLLATPYTDVTGSIADRELVRRCMDGVGAVIHAATLHKPHVATHDRREFVDTNITGTLNLLEEAVRVGVRTFVFTSTTSVFGEALTPPPDAPAVWVTEDLRPVPKNIYGVTKAAAEDLCELFHRREGLACLVLRTSRFFPEEDDSRKRRTAYTDANLKANEFLHRRVELSDVVDAHLLALECAAELGFGRYIISATPPFTPADCAALRRDAPAVVAARVPEYPPLYRHLGWKMYPSIERVYDNTRARRDLGWLPRWDFRRVIATLAAGEEPRSRLARAVGSKGYHEQVFSDGPYPAG